MFSGIREIVWEEEDNINISPQTQLLFMEISPYGNVGLFRQMSNGRQRQSYLYIENQRITSTFYSEHFLE